MSVILPQIPARLRRMLGRFVGPAGAALFSLVLASCAGGGFGGAPDTPAVNPVSQPAPAASGPISPESQRNVAEVVSGLKLGDETPPISPENIAVSDDAEILNRNPFSSPSPAARASDWGARADSTRKTPGYKAFEIAVPSENPLMTVAVWISETPPDYPEGKPEQDPEADRKFLYLRLQVFIEVGHVALVEGGGVEVLESQVIVVEEKRPDPKPKPKPQPVTLEAVTAETVCESGSLSANGMTQTELDEGLLSAARDNDLEGVCEYLRRGANIEAEDAPVPRWGANFIKRTPLVIAAVDGRLELARLLLNNGANINWQSGRQLSESVYDSSAGWSALAQAAGAGHRDVVELLLDRGADINIRWDFGRTALHEAAIYGRASVVELLLSRGVEADARDLNGETALHGAAWGANSGHSLSSRPTWEGQWGRVLDLLLDADADVNARSTRTSDWGPAGRVHVNAGWNGGRTPLDRAIAANKRSRALKLRSHGGVCNVESGPLCPPPVTVAATPDPVTLEAVTAETVCESGSLSANGLTQAQLDAGLISAAEGNDLPGACEYLRRGANVDARESGRYYKRTALMIAANDGFLDLAKLLHANGADVNLHGGTHDGNVYGRGLTALHYAGAAGRPELARWLLDSGAELNAEWVTGQGKTALWEAAYWGRPDVVELLLSRGAETETYYNGGATPLHAAVLLDEWGSARRYWANGPAFRYKRNAISYSYPIPTADEHGQVVSLLLSHDAEVNARYQSRSPLDYAARQGDERLSAMLRDAGGICYVETGPLCGVAEVVTAETVCASGSLSANGQTQAQLDAGLISAAEGNDLAGTCEYLRRGANVDARESGRYYKRTALMIATTDGRLELAKLLYANGADVNLAGGNHNGYDVGRGWTALQYSGAAGRPELAGWLLDSGAELNSEWESGKTALWEAAYWGRPDVVELLLSRGAETETYYNGGATPLHAAVLLDEWVSARVYWANGPAFRYKRNAISYSYPIPTANEHGQVVSLLLSHDAEVNARYQSRSPLDYAARQGDERLSAMLRDAGGICYVETGPLCGVAEVVTAETVCASGSLSANGQTQAQLDAGLISAAEGNDLAGTCEYLRRGANVDARESGRYYKRTALMIATTDGRLELAKLLYANGADVNLAGGNHNGYDVGRGWTALQYSGAAGRPELAGWLLDSGAELNSEWESGKTALWEAAYWGRPDVVELLLSRGAETETYYNGGATPLHAAVLLDEWVSARVYWANGPAFRYKRNAISYSYPIPTANEHGQVVSLLLSHDAEVNARYQGRSPLDYAARQGDERLSAMLRDAGGICYVETGPLCGAVHVAVDFSSSGSGTVSAEGGGDALSDGDDVRQGATVMFTATPAAGHYVSGWSGNCAEIGDVADGLDGTAKSCAVSAASDLSVRAEFSEIPSLAGPLCPSGSLSANGLTQAQLNAGLITAADGGDLAGVCEHLRRGAEVDGLGSSRRWSGWSALMVAAGKGRLEVMRLLLANGAQLDGRGVDGWTALHRAAGWGGQVEAARLLLDRGASVDAQADRQGAGYRRPLYEAAHWGRADVAELLLAHGADANAVDAWDITPLHGTASDVAQSGSAAIVSLLLSHGANLNPRRYQWNPSLITRAGDTGHSPLDDLVARGYGGFAEAARILRDAGGKCFVETGPLCGEVHVAVGFSSSGSGTVSAEGGGDALSDGDDVRQGATVMFTATPAAGHYVSGWSGNCAEIGDVADGLDGTAKFCAVSAASDLSVRAEFSEIPSLAGPLCESGSLSTNGLTQAQLDAGLISAAEGNDLPGACEYLRRGANVDARESGRYYKRTALMIAANDGFLDLAKLLHANGADVNLYGGTHDGNFYGRDRRGYPALHYAGVAGHPELVGWLLDSGAELNSEWESGKTALWDAAYWGRPDVVELLLSRGAETETYYNGGATPLHAAVMLEGVSARRYWANGPAFRYKQMALAYSYPTPTADEHGQVVSLLLSHDAEVNARYQGRSPLDYAARQGDERLSAMLRDAGGICYVETGPLCGEVHVAVGFSSSGSGTVSAEGDGEVLSVGGEVRQGATVMFTATPAAGHYVSGWSGNCAEVGDVADGLDGTAKFCAVSAASDLSVRAEFSEIPSLAGPLCASGSLSVNGQTQAQLDAGLISAAEGNDLAGACEYLRRGANVDARESGRYYKRTALMIATTDGRLELAKLLYANGADVNLDGGNHNGYDVGRGWTALQYSGAAGRPELAGWLLDSGAELNAEWETGKTALWEAAYWGRPDVVELLLSRGAETETYYNGGATPLHVAVIPDARVLWANGPAFRYKQMAISYSYPTPTADEHGQVVSLLLSHDAEVNARYQSRSPLDYAVRQGDERLSAMLRDAGGICYVETGPLCGAVHVAVDFSSSGSGTVSAEGDGGALSDGSEVRQGATVVFTATPAAGHYVSGWSGNCAEIGEVADGLDGAAKFCAVSADSDLSVRAEFSEIPSLAGPLCASGSLSANGLTQAQLDAGLLSAARDNDLEGACEYLRRGANVEAQESEWRYHKRTALMIAATDGGLDLAKLLRANGADVNRQGGNYHNSQDSAAPSNGNRRMSALHYASGAGHKDFVEWLLAEGADLHAKQTIKRDALWEAAFWGRVDIVKLFLSLGANVNARDVANGTPFLDTAHHSTYWARYGNQGWGVSDGYAQPLDSDWATVISLLVSHGTDVNARYTSGYSALDVAVSRGNAGSAEVLRGYGVRCFVRTGPLCGVPDVAVEYAVIPADESGGTVSAEGDDGVLSHEDEVRQGTTLTFTATPALGWMLSAWGGDAADCSGFVCALAANSDLSVHAEFSPILSRTDLSCPAGTLPTNGLTAAELNMTLRMAARGGDATRVCEALRRGAEVNDNLDDSEFTPLQEAVSGGHLEAAKVLLANGADVNKRKGGAGHSPLDLAARDGEAEIAALLRNADGRCFVETGPLCQSVPVATPDPMTVVNTVAATVAAGACPAGTLDANGMTQAQLNAGLLDAVWESEGETETICEYLRRGANVDALEITARSHPGSPNRRLTGLMMAAIRGWSEVARLLLDNGADPDSHSGGDASQGGLQGVDQLALNYAAAWGHVEVVRLLLDHGANINMVDAHGRGGLFEASFWGRWDIVNLLLERGANPQIQDKWGWSALHGAAHNRRARLACASHSVCPVASASANPSWTKVVSVLLSADVDVNARLTSAPRYSPLDEAVRRNHADFAAMLRGAGGQCFVQTGPLCGSVPVATPDPMTVAATVANTVVATVANTVVAEVENTVASTVAAGSCPAGTLPTNGMTQAQLDAGLFSAASSGDLAEACKHLRRGANPNGRDQNEHVPLMRASSQADLDMGKLLLDNGADLTVVWVAGGRWTPLFAQYNGGYTSARLAAQIEFYLSRGVDPNLGSSAWNPLHEAAYYNEWRSIKLLLDAGADPNIQTTRSGWRNGAPLHYVFDGTRSGSASAVSVLVAGDADVNLRDNYGRSALDLAANSGDAASAEILRAAGGQCFVSTRPLCGSAPASAAAAESAPATDRLRERFAGAFNPSPAFGDAFGAASGSSQRFLSRLDSLMRSASGSGGNAWDSFAGWQRENEHGRMWFSTGQRGDFGFGAGVGGAGGDLSASPFAAMVGNGMLAGGETGLGADGKLRIAAFADYQARSLLDGTDRQWTKWAASGTAIETAMTEAERFSGLAENQTRGAMTEIHLGGDELGVALQAGAVSESDAMLSGTADDENLRGLRARTAFAGLSGAANLFGSGWRLRGSAHLGRSWAESESMLRDGDLWASAFSAGLERGGWLYSDDGFILRVSQPLRVESLEMELIGESGASRLGADPSGRQLDVDAAYRLPLSGGGWLLLSAGVRRDGGHTSSSDLEAGALFSVERGF